MTTKAQEAKAVAAIERHGALLVYPLANRREPASLWTALHPRSPMNWSWDETADPRIVQLWHLRLRLAGSRAVVYGKWYKGRAVFFSRELFSAMLTVLSPWSFFASTESREILSLLEDNSPQTTKILRAEAGLRGRDNERVWMRSLDELWQHLLIVGTGEADDGTFPSLEVGATRWIFEDLWEDATTAEKSRAEALIDARLGQNPSFLRHFRKIRALTAGALPTP